MGKASRRKRERAAWQGMDDAVTVQPSPAPGSRLLIFLAAAVLVFAGVGWFVYHGTKIGTQPVSLLPDPDTTGMSPPAVRLIRDARLAALAAPESDEAVGRLCQVLHAHWLSDAAAECYAIARDLAPQEFRWAYLLAVVEEIRGADGEQVDRLFREARSLAPRYPPLHVRHADALLRLGQWEEARDAYATAVELDPSLVLAHRGLGQAATLLGDGPAAVEHLEEAAALSPEDRIVHTALARAYTMAGRPEQAAVAADKARTLKGAAALPDPVLFEVGQNAVHPEALRKRFSQALASGDSARAIEAARLLEESGEPAAMQQLAGAVKQRANQFAYQGDFASALPEYERAARLAPADPEIEHNWGTVLLRQGDLDAAAAHFRRAIELNPRSADSHYNLGVALEGLGFLDEAIVHFADAAAIDPQHVAATRLAELDAAADR